MVEILFKKSIVFLHKRVKRLWHTEGDFYSQRNSWQNIITIWIYVEYKQYEHPFIVKHFWFCRNLTDVMTSCLSELLLQFLFTELCTLVPGICCLMWTPSTPHHCCPCLTSAEVFSWSSPSLTWYPQTGVRNHYPSRSLLPPAACNTGHCRLVLMPGVMACQAADLCCT